jgi:hypothetical protein
VTAAGWGRGLLPTGKMVAAEHSILEKHHSSYMETSHSTDLFRRTATVRARDLVMSSSRPSIAMDQDLHFSAAHRLRPSPSDAAERSTICATKDAYRFEFSWIDGDRLPFDP